MSNTSFLPEDYIEKRSQRRTNLLCVSLFVVVMAGIVSAYFVQDRQWNDVSRLQARINARFEEAAKRIEQLDELQARKEQMVQKARVTSALIEPVPRTLILSELINNMPATLSLLEFNLDTRVVPQRVTATTALDKAKQEAKARKADSLLGGAGGGAPAEPEVPPTEVSVQVVGVAPTDVQVAQFMTALGRCALFSDLSLAFSEEVVIDEHTMRKFRVEMKVNQDLDVQQVEPTRVERLAQNPMANTIQIDAQGKLVTPSEPKPRARAVQVSN
jgi:hypothetical protein